MDIFRPIHGHTLKAQKSHTHPPMNSSKLALTITGVVFFHLAVVSIILLQPGCNSATPPPVAANTTAAAPPPADLVDPTRPTVPTTPVPEGNLTSSEPLTATSSGLNTGTPTSTGPTVTYEVKKGDSLSKIAKSEKVSLAELEAANNLTSKSVLKLGQTLTIPTSASPAPAAPTSTSTTTEPASTTGGSTYTVKTGDSLSAIAHKTGTSVTALKEANHLTTNNIHAGQVLTLPAAGSASTAATPSPSTATAAPEEGVYVVQSGDSPEKIAKKEGVKAADLMKLNNISDPRSLRVGQKLKLPTGAKTPALSTTTSLASPTAPTEPSTAAPLPSVTTTAPTPVAGNSTTTPAGNTTMEDVPVTPVTPN